MAFNQLTTFIWCYVMIIFPLSSGLSRNGNSFPLGVNKVISDSESAKKNYVYFVVANSLRRRQCFNL